MEKFACVNFFGWSFQIAMFSFSNFRSQNSALKLFGGPEPLINYFKEKALTKHYYANMHTGFWCFLFFFWIFTSESLEWSRDSIWSIIWHYGRYFSNYNNNRFHCYKCAMSAFIGSFSLWMKWNGEMVTIALCWCIECRLKLKLTMQQLSLYRG